MAISAAQLVVSLTAQGVQQTEAAINRVSGAVDKAAGGFDKMYEVVNKPMTPGVSQVLPDLQAVDKQVDSTSVGFEELNRTIGTTPDTGLEAVTGELQQVDRGARQAEAGFEKFSVSAVMGSNRILSALDGISKAMGAIAVIGGITLIAGGAKAAWGQVSAVEQATVALRAYESSASAVDGVLEELVAYARSDMGVLFQRQDLFNAAQGLRVMGAATSDLTEYVKIMSRSVGVGAGTWDELNQVIGRVGSTGRITGDDFDMLTKMGFQLDTSLRNVNVTWDELFSALDRGIPVNAMEGQASTIEGMVIRIQSAIRGIGTAFLGVDADTSRFISGGLGDQLTSWLADAPALIKNFQGAAAGLGNTIADIASVIGSIVSTFQNLPGPIQTAVSSILKLVAAFGALRVAGKAMGMIGALTGLGGIGSMLGGVVGGGAGAGMFKAGTTGAVGFGGALATLLTRITPVGVALTVLGGAGVLVAKMMGDNRRAAEEAAQGLADYEAAVQSLDDTIRQATLAGDLDLVRQLKDMQETVDTTLSGITTTWERHQADWSNMMDDNGWIQGTWDPNDLATYITGNWGEAFKQANLDGVISDEVYTAITTGQADALDQADWSIVNHWMDGLIAEMIPDDAQKATILNSVNGIFDLMQNDLVDTTALMGDFNAIWAEFGQTGNVDKLISDLDALHDATLQIIELGQGQVEYDYMAMLGMTDIAEDIQHVHQLHDAMAGVNDQLSAGQQQAYGEAWQGIFEAIRSGEYDNDAIIGQIRELNYLFTIGEIDALEYAQGIVDLNAGIEDLRISFESAGEAANGFGQIMADSAEGTLKDYEEQLEAIREMLTGVLDVLGRSGLTSMLGLAGIGGEAVQFADNVNRASASLDDTFRVIVGNTNAIGSQIEGVKTWADELIGVAGEYGKIDDLLAKNLITQEQYNDAQRAYNVIGMANAQVQNDILAIQAQQAPLIAAQTNALAQYMREIRLMNDGTVEGMVKQQAALGFMDQGMQESLGNVIELGSQMKQMGPEGEAAFRQMAEGIAASNPILFSMMEQVGLVTDVVRDADGTVLSFEVNLDGADSVLTAINALTESIDVLIVALGGTPPALQAAIDAMHDYGRAARDATIAALGLADAQPTPGPSNDVPTVTGLPNAGSGNPLGNIGNILKPVVLDVFADTTNADKAINDLAANPPTVNVPVSVTMANAGASAGGAAAGLASDIFSDVSIKIDADTSGWDTALANATALDGSTIATTYVWAIGNDESAANMISSYQSRANETLAEMMVWAIADDTSAANMISHYQGREAETLASMYVWGIGDGSSAINMIDALQKYDGSILATTYVDIVTRRIDPGGDGNSLGSWAGDFARRATGGMVSEDMTLVGELGPELVSLPRGSYVHTNADSVRMANSGKGGNNDNSITVNLNGATFHNTSREEMNAWAENDLIPGITRAVADRRTGMGA